MLTLELDEPVVDGREMAHTIEIGLNRAIDGRRQAARADECAKLLQAFTLKRQSDLFAGHGVW